MRYKSIPVHCPFCGGRLMDANAAVKTQTKVVDMEEAAKSPEFGIADYYLKCWKCKQKIAVKKVG